MNSLRPQFAETIARVGDADENLFVVVGDISHGLLSQFRDRHLSRYRNIGICEPSMISICAGLNLVGFNPVVHTIAPFLIERSFEQIKLDFGYQNLGCNLVSVGSSFDYAKLGCSHHSYIDSALVASIEGSMVFLPGSPSEFDILFRQNYNKPGIKYFRLTENGHGFDLQLSEKATGKNIVIREGLDLTIVALGPALERAFSVSDFLYRDGISAEIIYVNSFKPFDADSIIQSVNKTRKLITISDISDVGGLQSKCLESISGKFAFESLDFSVRTFVRGYGEYEDLLKRAKLDSNSIYTGISKLFLGA